MKMVVICAGCQLPIYDRFLLNVLERAWHARCVTCADCDAPLTDKCFAREGKLFCRDHFFRRFGTKCGGCGQGISPNDLVRRARGAVYHVKCFTCVVCQRLLDTGDQLYILDEERLICRDDYIARYQASEADDNDDFDGALLDKLSGDGMMTPGKDHVASRLDLYAPGSDAQLPPSCATYRPSDDVDSTLGGRPFASQGQGHHGHGHGHRHDDSSKVKVKSEHSDIADRGQQFANVNDKQPTAGDAAIMAPSALTRLSVTSSSRDSKEADSKSCSDDKSDTSECCRDDAASSTGGTKEDGGSGGAQGGSGSSTGAPQPGCTKRRGPRTTIKAKQLETLKAAFNATPKPTRHIREQLAQETGLNMRVIQVWFQNRRSKERRMKQLSALGARRQFFRNPRSSRLRVLDDPTQELLGPGFGYFADNGDFYHSFPPYPGDFFPGHGPPPDMSFLQAAGPPPGVDGTTGLSMVHPDGQYGDMGVGMGAMAPQRSPCTDPTGALAHHLGVQGPPDGLYPPRGAQQPDYPPRHFTQGPPEMTVDSW